MNNPIWPRAWIAAGFVYWLRRADGMLICTRRNDWYTHHRLDWLDCRFDRQWPGDIG